MDGVLWHDSEPIGDLPAIFRQIAALGLRVILATNNASRTISEYQAKLAGMGVNLASDQILSAAEATSAWLQEQHPGANIYVIGTNSFVSILRDQGFKILPVDQSSGADFVVVALDPQFDYRKLRNASLQVQAGARFIATNGDVTFPTPQGPVPGAGSLTAALQAATGVTPKYIGKPSPIMYLEAARRMELDPREIMGIGDRIDTDIVGAIDAGMLSGLVLSGITSAEQARDFPGKIDIVASSLPELLHGKAIHL